MNTGARARMGEVVDESPTRACSISKDCKPCGADAEAELRACNRGAKECKPCASWDRCNFGRGYCQHQMLGLGPIPDVSECMALRQRLEAIELLGCHGPSLRSASMAVALNTSFRSCAIVGSSGSLLTRRAGEEIDTHSAIFRFNDAPVLGYEPHVGSRTTIRFCNGQNFRCVDDAALRVGALQYPTPAEWDKYTGSTCGAVRSPPGLEP